MQSNSKITRAEKDYLAYAEGKGRIGFATSGRVTVAVVITGPHTARMGVSIASPDEKKFRPKVGKFYALQNLQNAGVPVPRVLRNYNAEETAIEMASMLS